MLKKMILINSANFELAEIDLSREVQFVGENTSGKTTTTRALHYAYNANGDKLGIPRQKDSFNKHYFQYDDSYIIYIFEDFFIFTYKKNGVIHRYFSKQKFDLDRIIQGNRLLPFEEIRSYIKEAHYVKPDSISQYIDIIYGRNRTKSDFSIAQIDNHNVFLEVYNMVFNVDKAIVDAKSIKNAIQKSLNRDDRALVFDFDNYSNSLRRFTNDYSFFKIFDSNRQRISKALSLKDTLIEKEHKKGVLHKAMSYRNAVEKELIENFTKEVEERKALIDSNRKKISIRKKRKDESTIPYISKKINDHFLNIERLENLSEEYSIENYEENSILAATYERVNNDFLSKNSQLQQLISEQKKASEILDKQILDLQNHIETIIPREVDTKAFNLIHSEKTIHEDEKIDIEYEYSIKESMIDENILSINKSIEEKTATKITEQEKSSDEIRKLNEDWYIYSEKTKNTIDSYGTSIENTKKEIVSVEEVKHNLRKEKDALEQKYHDARIVDLKILCEKRNETHKKIRSIQVLLEKKPGSFKEYLSENVENWEKEVYPIIDKELLSMQTSMLNPTLVRENNLFGIDLDRENLKSIPTPDEAIELIRGLKALKSENFHIYKEQTRSKRASLEEKLNALDAKIEEQEAKIKNFSNKIGQLTKDKTELSSKLKSDEDDHKDKKKEIQYSLKNTLSHLNDEVDALITERKKTVKDKQQLKREKRTEIQKSLDKFIENKNKILSSFEKEKQERVGETKEKIKELSKQKSTTEENDLITLLTGEVESLDKSRNECIQAKKFLNKYDDAQEKIKDLPKLKWEKESLLIFKNKLNAKLKETITLLEEKNAKLRDDADAAQKSNKRYRDGIRLFDELKLDITEEKLDTDEFLYDIVSRYKELKTEYLNEKSTLRTTLDRLSELSKYSILDINLDTRILDETDSIQDAEAIIESLVEIEEFQLNRYNSIKKASHKDFENFLKNTLPQKLLTFHDLESDFKKTVNRINNNLSRADFGAIRDIRLNIQDSQTSQDSIGKLLEELGKKVDDSKNLYSEKSLFFHDISKSIENIDKIQEILKNIQKKSQGGEINLYDTIDLSISFIENGKKNENLTQIKDDSSSGGRILLKVAIAISILNLYYNKPKEDSPFYLIIDEISRLQAKNQKLLKQYINDNGFKTLFITPDPSYPDPKEAIFYTFKNIINEGDSLEVTQVNFI